MVEQFAPRSTALPADQRAIIAVDLGAESCRVSLLRWIDGAPSITLAHRFPNGPEQRDGLRWPLEQIENGIDEGMRHAATLAPEGVRSVAVDGWAVDYVRLSQNSSALADPFCYRDDRTIASEQDLHERISPDALRRMTGVQVSRINTLYQLCADRMMGLDPGSGWLNLPEYFLMRWSSRRVAEYTNATHTQLLDANTHNWCPAIFTAAGLQLNDAPHLVAAGTSLGQMRGPLANLPAFTRTQVIAPACHDTASAIAGIALPGNDWAYISSGTWSLIGRVLKQPCEAPEAIADGFTNLGAVGGKICFHRAINGMWLLKQCMDAWSAEGKSWNIQALMEAAADAPTPEVLLDMEHPELLLLGAMPERLDRICRARGASPLDQTSAGAPRMAALIIHSLAAEYAKVIAQLERHTATPVRRIVIVGGGSQNDLLLRLTALHSKREVLRGTAESSTIGNFAVQLATLESGIDGNNAQFAAEVTSWASRLTAATLH